MNCAVEFTHDAFGDLGGIVNFLTNGNSENGAAFVEALVGQVRAKIGMLPYSGPAVGRHRFTVFRGYVVAYCVDEAGKRFVVVLVTEGHRNWRAVLADR